MPSIDTPSASVAWAERGHGPAVVLIHGGLFDPMTGSRFWISPGVADDIAGAGFHVLVPDRRFFPGQTRADFTSHSWEREADDIAAVLDADGTDRAHIVAGSNGCSVAACFALQYPARVGSLLLCWPATPTSAALRASFELSADAVEQRGPAAYLDGLRRDGVPRIGEDRPGFPFGFALLHDRRAAMSFLALSPVEAAAIFRATAAALLPGEPIRGLTREKAARLASDTFSIGIVPPDPEDPYHRRSTARQLCDAIPGAMLLDGFPVTPSRFFADARVEFTGALLKVLRSAETGGIAVPDPPLP